MAETDINIYGRIYVIENLVNGKKYVGQTISSVKRRFASHCSNSSSTSSIHCAIQKYGKSNFKISQIDVASNKSELNEKEIYYISLLGTQDGKVGYNIKPGGEAGGRPTVESRLKMSKAKVGRKLTEEHKEKLSNAMKGRVFSEEHSKNISLAKKGKTFRSEEWRENKSKQMTGWVMPESHRQAIIKSNTGKKHSEERKAKARAGILAYHAKRKESLVHS